MGGIVQNSGDETKKEGGPSMHKQVHIKYGAWHEKPGGEAYD